MKAFFFSTFHQIFIISPILKFFWFSAETSQLRWRKTFSRNNIIWYKFFSKFAPSLPILKEKSVFFKAKTFLQSNQTFVRYFGQSEISSFIALKRFPFLHIFQFFYNLGSKQFIDRNQRCVVSYENNFFCRSIQYFCFWAAGNGESRRISKTLVQFSEQNKCKIDVTYEHPTTFTRFNLNHTNAGNKIRARSIIRQMIFPYKNSWFEDFLKLLLNPEEALRRCDSCHFAIYKFIKKD